MTGMPLLVLVVDDDPAIRGFLSETLLDEGYEVRDAANGQEALDALDAWHADVILLDLMMPVMDGWTFRQRQLEAGSINHIPVIVMSAARALPDERLRAVATFSKPFDLGTLLETVQRVATGRDLGRQPVKTREPAA